MLSKLCIKNYILIEDLTIPFESGLNIISGETGAGKSIILSSIAFVLGAKTDKNVIRTNKDFARVEIQFDQVDIVTLDILSQYGIEHDESLIISRRLSNDGKNDIRVNGQIVTLFMLRHIATHLLEIYGQHAYQILLDESKHIDFVDAVLGTKLDKFLLDLGELIKKKQLIVKELDELVGDDITREREKQILEYQINEIKQANLQIDEEQELRDQMLKMKNTQKVIGGLECLDNILNSCDSTNVMTMLYNAGHNISSLVDIDKDVLSIYNRIESVRLEVDDIAQTAQNIMTKYDFSQEDFARVDERLDTINNLKRKYGTDIAQILDFCDEAAAKLNKLQNSEQYITQQKQALVKLEEQIVNICAEITKIRTQAGISLQKCLLEQLETLGIKKAQFEIKIEPSNITNKGADNVSFWFSANLGQKLMPLAKVISGGEMSRFMLAFDIVFGQKQFGTLIFDEIDTGLSGEISHDVALKLYQLSRNNQVIAITHLPAICAMADVNFKVQKNIVGGNTITTLERLGDSDNIYEIARLAGAINCSQIALKSAQELKTICNQQKQRFASN